MQRNNMSMLQHQLQNLIHSFKVFQFNFSLCILEKKKKKKASSSLPPTTFKAKLKMKIKQPMFDIQLDERLSYASICHVSNLKINSVFNSF